MPCDQTDRQPIMLNILTFIHAVYALCMPRRFRTYWCCLSPIVPEVCLVVLPAMDCMIKFVTFVSLWVKSLILFYAWAQSAIWSNWVEVTRFGWDKTVEVSRQRPTAWWLVGHDGVGKVIGKHEKSRGPNIKPWGTSELNYKINTFVRSLDFQLPWKTFFK